MGQTTIKGIGEDGILKTEYKSTPVLITELIGDLHKLCEAELYDRLKDIRESSEQDERTKKTLAAVLRKNRAEEAKREVADE